MSCDCDVEKSHMKELVLSAALPLIVAIIMLTIFCFSISKKSDQCLENTDTSDMQDVQTENQIQSQHELKADAQYMLAEINYANDQAWDMTAQITNSKTTNQSTTQSTVESGKVNRNYIGMKLPLFLQWDRNWGSYPYGQSGTIASSGCGPTSFAMVLAGLTRNRAVNPKMIADWSHTNGHRVEGVGSAWSLFTDGSAHFGIKCTEIGVNQNEIYQSLHNGKPIITSMTAGHFTSDGHFIVLRGIAPDGRIVVSDPNSLNNSLKTWDIRIIIAECVGAWAFSV